MAVAKASTMTLLHLHSAEGATTSLHNADDYNAVI